MTGPRARRRVGRTTVSGTLQTLLERHAPLLGRRRELELLLELAERDRPIAAVVHGIAGVGKSTLLRRFAADVSSRWKTS